MAGIVEAIKYSPMVVGFYEKMLESKCRSVDGYIFVATTGRSGSDSLSKIFQAADDAVCFHEPYPIMFSDYDDPATKKAYFDKLFYQRKKINVKRAAAGHRYYVETNHQFLKNFFVQSAEYFGDKLRVIHMYRDPVRVGSSFFSIDSIPGKTPTGKHYLLDPAHDDNLLQVNDLLTGDPDFSHDLYRCIWYWYEIEARVKKYKTDFPSVTWAELKTEELNDKDALVRMFNQLGVTFNPERLEQLAGSRENLKKNLKKKSVDLSEAEAMNAKLLGKLEERYGKDFWK